MIENDKIFLKALDNERNKFYYARIDILDNFEKTIKSIEGRVQAGSSISINGNSSVRRTCNITLVATDAENDLTNIDNFLSINKKIKIAVGIQKNIDYAKDILYYDYIDAEGGDQFPAIGQKGKIYVNRRLSTYWIWNGKAYQQINSIYDYESELVWFPLGVFVINQPNLNHTTSGCVISLSCKDKMCLLNGEMGGNLPTSVTFHEYNQIIGELECNTLPADPNNYTIYKCDGQYYSWTREYGWKEEANNNQVGQIVSVPQLFYDIIQTVVANYGKEDLSRIIINDVPLEIKQLVRYVGSTPLYFNSATGQYTTDTVYVTDTDLWKTFKFNEDVGYVYTDFTYPGALVSNIGDNVCSVLDKIKNTLGNFEYFYDIDGNFVFQEVKNYLNTSYIPTEEERGVKEYYLGDAGDAIKSNSLRILGQENYKVDFYSNQEAVYNFDENNGLITSYSNSPSYMNLKNDYHIWGKTSTGLAIHYHLVIKDQPTEMQTRKVIFLRDNNGKLTGRIRLPQSDEVGEDYTPTDWRAELYLQGLEIAAAGGRPDIYQQELLDLFDDIYEWAYVDDNGQDVKEGRFKVDIVNNANDLHYFIDYLEPTDSLYGVAVDDIDTKIYSYQQDKITRLYDNEVPDFIIIDEDMDDIYENEIMTKCDNQGQQHSVVDGTVYQKLAIGTVGYSAQETVRNFLYQYTSYNESISIQSIPIYYLDVNKRITVRDKKAGISGDYIIKTITLPLSPSSTMSISASRALSRM